MTASQVCADLAREYIDHGDLTWRQTNLNREIGTNLRFNDVLSALGIAQMRTLDCACARKRARAQCVAVKFSWASSLLRVRATKRRSSTSFLRASRIGWLRNYEPVISARCDNIARSLNTRRMPTSPILVFRISDWWTDYAVYFPFGLALSQDDARRVGEAIRDTRIELMAPSENSIPRRPLRTDASPNSLQPTE